jgi:glycosyltransferase involved in cell wall biosynthesis
VFFSIVIPSFNSNYIERTIQSVIQQNYSGWELIIVDNNSSNNISDLVKNYRDYPIKLINIANKGIIAKSRNLGILESKFNWICFLDSDDFWVQDKLFEVKKFIEMNGLKKGILYHSVANSNKKNNKGKLLKNLSKKISKPYFDNLLINGNYIAQSSVIVDKHTLHSVNMYDENVKKFSWEDYDLWLRLSKSNNNFYHINKTLGYIWTEEEEGRISNQKQSFINSLNFLHYYKNDLKKITHNNYVYSQVYKDILNYYFNTKSFLKFFVQFKKIKKKNFKMYIKFVLIFFYRFQKK